MNIYPKYIEVTTNIIFQKTLMMNHLTFLIKIKIFLLLLTFTKVFLINLSTFLSGNIYIDYFPVQKLKMH